jgi:hypothetical protein
MDAEDPRGLGDGCGGPKGFGVPPGIADAVTPNPTFSFAPSATVDEGNNWINVSWGPLALTNPSRTGGANGNYGGGPALANYNLTPASPAINFVPIGQPHPSTDFYGNPRPEPNEGSPARFDPGAIEFGSFPGVASGTGVAAGPLAFTAATNATLATVGGVVQTLTFTIPAGRPPVTSVVTITNNGPAGSTPVAITAESVTGIANTLFSSAGTTCGATLAPGATCTISITYATPAAPPLLALGVAAVTNNGSGTTMNGSTDLVLIGR